MPFPEQCMSFFLSSYPQATSQPATVPHNIISVLLIEKPDWTSNNWTLWFHSTTHSYESAKIKYLQFCLKSNVSPIPVTEGKLCSFVSIWANSGLAHQTIKCYLSAIRHLQIESGREDSQISTMPKLEHVLRGIKKEHSKQANITKPRLPMTPNIHLKLRSVWEKDASNFNHIMLWAACCTCYFGFLRSGNKHPVRQRIWSFNPLKLRRYCCRLSWKHIHHCNQDEGIKDWPLQAWYYNLLRSDKYQAMPRKSYSGLHCSERPQTRTSLHVCKPTRT